MTSIQISVILFLLLSPLPTFCSPAIHKSASKGTKPIHVINLQDLVKAPQAKYLQQPSSILPNTNRQGPSSRPPGLLDPPGLSNPPGNGNGNGPGNGEGISKRKSPKPCSEVDCTTAEEVAFCDSPENKIERDVTFLALWSTLETGTIFGFALTDFPGNPATVIPNISGPSGAAFFVLYQGIPIDNAPLLAISRLRPTFNGELPDGPSTFKISLLHVYRDNFEPAPLRTVLASYGTFTDNSCDLDGPATGPVKISTLPSETIVQSLRSNLTSLNGLLQLNFGAEVFVTEIEVVLGNDECMDVYTGTMTPCCLFRPDAEIHIPGYCFEKPSFP